VVPGCNESLGSQSRLCDATGHHARVIQPERSFNQRDSGRLPAFNAFQDSVRERDRSNQGRDVALSLIMWLYLLWLFLRLLLVQT
jgi:hypothetical protein